METQNEKIWLLNARQTQNVYRLGMEGVDCLISIEILLTNMKSRYIEFEYEMKNLLSFFQYLNVSLQFFQEEELFTDDCKVSAYICISVCCGR